MYAAEQPSYPWSGTAPIRGNLAIGNLRENLKRKVITEHGIHAQTLLAASGAVAGFAGQHALWSITGLTPSVVPTFTSGQKPPNSELVAMQLTSGECLFFGDQLNAYLTGRRGQVDRYFLWGFVYSSLIRLGIAPDAMPATAAMYSNVSKTIGTPSFGYPSVPKQHRPHFPADQFIKTVWPFIRNVLTLPPPSGVAEHEPVIQQRDWSIISSIVAGQLIVETSQYVDPRVAAVLVMEAAIAASKLDPRSIAVS